MSSSRTIIVSLLVTVTACGIRTSFTPTNLPPRPMQRRAPESVLMFTSTAPTRPFVEVGLISSAHAGAYSLANDDEVILGLRNKAAEVGCDAVYLQAETTSHFAQASGNTASTRALKSFRAACIMFTDAVGQGS